MTTTDVDLFVGKRLFRRRRILGMTQKQLAAQVGVQFQQIQKYECGANRITSSRLFSIATALNVSVNYFFEGLAHAPASTDVNALTPEHSISGKEYENVLRCYARLHGIPEDLFVSGETRDLMQALGTMSEEQRQLFIKLVLKTAEASDARSSVSGRQPLAQAA